MSTTASSPYALPAPPALLGHDHLEFYVGNARQAARFYEQCFGFGVVAYRGPETGHRTTVSYALAQGDVRLVVTSALRPDHEVAEHVRRHGDGVRVLALAVADARGAHDAALARGAESAQWPRVHEDEHGSVRTAAIHTYGDTVHVFVERGGYRGAFLPGFRDSGPYFTPGLRGEPVGLRHVDHAVGNVERGEMDRWVRFYREVMGFDLLVTYDDDDISTAYSALMSKVVSGGGGRVKFPINEPAEGKRKSQVEEYLDFYGGPGVQHVALATDDIVATVTALRRRGVDFLEVPVDYYETLAARVGDIDEDLAALRRLHILVDRDDEGYLLQIFTKPVQDRPTVFFEIIQRRGARSFGKGNFKALFEAVEREQGRRGNL